MFSIKSCFSWLTPINILQKSQLNPNFMLVLINESFLNFTLSLYNFSNLSWDVKEEKHYEGENFVNA